MRPVGTMHPTDQVPLPPDTVCTLLIAASSGQAMDWPTGTEMARVTAQTTAGAQLNCFVNLFSTAAAVPTTGTATASTGVTHAINGTAMYQIPGTSTGFSVASLSSGYIVVECWGR